MSLLEAVTEARELREVASREFRRAVARAHEGGHSLREIGRAAGLSHQGVRWVLRRDPRQREETKT